MRRSKLGAVATVAAVALAMFSFAPVASADDAGRIANWTVHVYPQKDGTNRTLDEILAAMNTDGEATFAPDNDRFVTTTYSGAVPDDEAGSFLDYTGSRFGLGDDVYDHYIQADDGTYYGITKQIRVKNSFMAGTAWGAAGKPYSGPIFLNATEPYDIEMWAIGNAIPTIDARDLTIAQGDEFDPLAGVSATDKEDGDLTPAIQVAENTVNPDVPGTYKVVYTVVDGGHGASRRTVAVKVAARPVVDGAQDLAVAAGSTFDPLAGVSAADADGNPIELTAADVTGTVDTTRPGTYPLTYTVTDAAGITRTFTRTVTVRNAPAAKSAAVAVAAGSAFDPLRAASFTDADGAAIDPANVTVVSGSVDTSKPGVYAVTYKVTDRYGVSSEVTVEYTVEGAPASAEAGGAAGQTDSKGSVAAAKGGLPVTGAAFGVVALGMLALVAAGGLGAVAVRRMRR